MERIFFSVLLSLQASEQFPVHTHANNTQLANRTVRHTHSHKQGML